MEQLLQIPVFFHEGQSLFKKGSTVKGKNLVLDEQGKSSAIVIFVSLFLTVFNCYRVLSS